MKKLFLVSRLAGAAALAFTGSASAADMPVKAPIIAPAQVSSWTGWYLGVNLGAGWLSSGADIAPADADTTTLFSPGIAAGTLATSLAARDQGILGGAQLGYNWQINRIVMGVEADFQGAGLNAHTQILGAPAGFVPILSNYDSRITSFGTVRARGGVLIAPSLLTYVTGGYAFGEVQRHWDFAFMEPGPVLGTSGDISTLDSGWTIGGGVEWALATHWSLGAEYLHVRLNGQNFSNTQFFSTPGFGGFACAAAGSFCEFQVSGRASDLDILRAKLNFRF